MAARAGKPYLRLRAGLAEAARRRSRRAASRSALPVSPRWSWWMLGSDHVTCAVHSTVNADADTDADASRSSSSS